MVKGFFHRFYEDYTEQRLPDADGKLHTQRTYKGFFYCPRLTRLQRLLRATACCILYGGGMSFFIAGAASRAVCNTVWYVALTTGLALICGLIELIPLCCCAFGKAEQTVYQYRSGHCTCVRWSGITAGAMALTALLALIATLTAGEAVGTPVRLFALACLLEAAIWLIEARVAYDRKCNPNA